MQIKNNPAVIVMLLLEINSQLLNNYEPYFKGFSLQLNLQILNKRVQETTLSCLEITPLLSIQLNTDWCRLN